MNASRLVLLAMVFFSLAANSVLEGESAPVWVGSWAASQQLPEAQNLLGEDDLRDATLRQVVHLSLGGRTVRVHLSNAFGTAPLHLSSVHIARPIAGSSAAINRGTDKPLSFQGRSDVTVPAGAEFISDPLEYPVAPLSDIAISIHFDNPPEQQTGHPGSRATSYLAHGDFASAADLPHAKRIDHWYQVSGIDVMAPPDAASIVVLGDSITDGHGATTNGNDRWTDVLARRLQDAPASRNIGVLNQGIGGNHLLTDGLGPNALARFDRDVLAQAGVRYLIVLEGVNDLGGLTRNGEVGPGEHAAFVQRVLAAYEQIISRAHTHGIQAIGATILPYAGSSYYHPGPANEADRQSVNEWIRAPGHFDAVIDFDRIARDPAHPDRLLPAFDSGDHLHPSPAGYAAMADAVPLSLFAKMPQTDTSALLPPSHVDNFTGHPRVVVISDIGNEPDDQMSLTRLLLYSNELDIEALIAATSTWQKTVVHPETMRELIEAYGRLRPNLLLHAPGWPAAEDLNNRVYSGQPGYGMAATGPDRMSEGAQAIIQAADRNDDRPLWITVWGGTNTLAQALLHVRATRPPEELDKLIAKLRVYSISDQDDAGPWIRREFPNLFYIVQPSTPTGAEYYYATWTGISGDAYYRNCAGANFTSVTNEWLEANIRSKGPLGKLYPRFLFIMEGDTPSFLGLIDNGLNSFRRPDWGGWGGRYIYRQPYGETHAIWTQGGDLFSRVTSQDTVMGSDGQQHISDQATIWRWREAFQNDFAARMDWTVKDYRHANHNPVLEVNGQRGTAPVVIDAAVGGPVTLDASRSVDPDGQPLQYRWFHYAEAGSADASLADVTMSGADGAKAVVTATATCRPAWLKTNAPCPAAGTAHIILAVTDSGSPRLTSYRRIILNVHAAVK